MAAVQFAEIPYYKCLVTRKNRKELIGPDSIWRNLNDWLTRPELPDHLRLNPREHINKSDLLITFPSGATIWFRYYDDEESRNKLKSESYDRAVNDEASELKEKVLRFIYRSIRNPLSNNIPLSVLNLSNPGGPSTDYLCEDYVDGDYKYYALDWRHNPTIDPKVYAKSLDHLDYIDQKYQKEGDWHYKPAKGELFLEQDLIDSLIPQLPKHTQFIRNVRGIDMAVTKNGDRSWFIQWFKDERGHCYMNDPVMVQDEFPENTLIDLVEKDNPDWFLGEFNTEYYFEYEAGSAAIHQERFIRELLKDYIEQGLFIDFSRNTNNKFTRARPMAHAIKNLNVSIVGNKEDEIIKTLIDEYKDFGPDEKEYEYDDGIDAGSIGFNELNPLKEEGTVEYKSFTNAR